MGIVRGLRVSGVESDGSGDHQRGRPPRGAGSSSSPHLVRDEQRGSGELERGEDVQRFEVPAPGHDEGQRVQKRREWRLAVDDVAVQDTASLHDHPHRCDCGFVGVEQPARQSWGVGNQRAGKDRRNRFRCALGSAAEVASCLDVALALDYVDAAAIADALALVDRVRAMTYRLANG